MNLATLIRPTRRKATRIGPSHDGRRMSLALFDRVRTEPGYLYELGKGVIEVSEIPDIWHAMVEDSLRESLSEYRRDHPGVITLIGGGSSAKIPVESTQSERHPDISVYRTQHPGIAQPWDVWVPEIVVEIVSDSSRKRDYDVKPDEYLAFGVKEYWLIDPAKSVVIAHQRVGGLFQKKSLKPGQKYKTHVLPKFVLDISKLLASAKR